METKTATFKMFAAFQYLENYSDTDKPYWKCKGGDDVMVMDGITSDMLCYKDDLCAAVDQSILEPHIWRNSGSEQYFLGFYFVDASKPTEREIMDAYEMGIDLEAPEEVEPVVESIEDKYERMAAELGY